MHISRRTRQSASYLEHKRRKIVWVLISVVLIIVIGVLILSWLTKLSVFRITSVRIYGADPDINQSLQSSVETAISGSYFGLFPKDNVFIYPRGAVIRAAKDSSGRIDTVETSLNDLHQISITITEKTPAALVCPDFPNIDTVSSLDNQCYFIDKTGLIYSEAPDISSNIYHQYFIPNIGENSTSTIVGSYATSTEEFTHLQSFYNGVQAANLEVESILVKEKGEYEMYVLNPDKSIAIIYFNDNRSLTEELSNLLSFWTYMVTDVRSAKTPPSFDYIDVRYGTNVFYRVNGGVVSSK